MGHLLLLISITHILQHCISSYEIRENRPACTLGWVWDTERHSCLTADHVPLSWYSARLHCSRIGAAQVLIPNREANQFIVKNVIAPEKQYWLGVPERKTPNQTGYTNYLSKKETRKVGCPSIDSRDGNWRTDSCHAKKGFICEMKNVNDCVKSKCEHVCVIDGTRASHCECYPGYYYDDKSKQCKDINECSKPNKCDQQCRNTIGDYTCYCSPGYVNIGGDGDDACSHPLWSENIEKGVNESGTSAIMSILLFCIPLAACAIFIVSLIRLKKMRKAAEIALLNETESRWLEDNEDNTPLAESDVQLATGEIDVMGDWRLGSSI